MLNNITNFFNLIKTGKVKTQLDGTDLLPIGTRDNRFTGQYQPTMIKYSDLVAGLVGGSNGQVLFNDNDTIAGASNLYWDKLNERVGIGTSTPNAPLHIESATNASLFTRVKNTNAGSQSTAGYIVEGTTVSGHFFASPSGYNPYSVIGGSQLNIYTTNTFALMIDALNTTFKIGVGSGGPERMRIVGNTGNVLIGTTTDAGYKLDVNGDTKTLGLLTAYGISTNLSDMAIYNTTNNTGYIRFITQTSSAQAERLRIATTGNVLINTTTDAGYRLDVNGDTRSTNFRLTDNTLIASAYTVGGTTLNVSNIGHYGAIGINVSSATGLRASSTVGLDPSGPTQASIYAAGGATAGRISLGLLSNRALITSVASGTAMHNSSMLQVDSTTQGFLPPRMTSAERTAILTPAVGLMVYQTDATEGLYIYKSTGWALNS